MKKVNFISVLILLSIVFSCNLSNHPPSGEPAVTDETLNSEISTPEEQGMDSETLADMLRTAREENILVNSIVIARNGRLVLDAHFYPNQKEYLHDVASVTKSITSAIIGIAIDKGYIKNEEQKISEIFPEHSSLFDSDRKRKLNVKHLLTMTSGLCTDFAGGESQLDAMRLAKNTVEYILSQELLSEPGTGFAYCSCATQLLSAIITKSTGKKMEDFGKAFLFAPLGIEEYIMTEDKSGHTNGFGDSYWFATDLLKIGQLYLDGGLWKGKRIISESWIRKSSTEQIRLPNGDGSYGYKWWIPNELEGLYEGRGRGEQRLVVYPPERLVVVMTGTGFDPGALGAFIIGSIQSESALTPNDAGNAELKEKLEAILLPPPAINDIRIPVTAKNIENKKYIFEPNAFGLTHFKLRVSDPSDAELTLGLHIDRSEEYGDRLVPLGMNGQYKLSNATRFGTPMAAHAKWLGEHEVEIDYNEFSNNHKYLINIGFEKDGSANWRMFDEAGFGEELLLKASPAIEE